MPKTLALISQRKYSFLGAKLMRLFSPAPFSRDFAAVHDMRRVFEHTSTSADRKLLRRRNIRAAENAFSLLRDSPPSLNGGLTVQSTPVIAADVANTSHRIRFIQLKDFGIRYYIDTFAHLAMPRAIRPPLPPTPVSVHFVPPHPLTSREICLQMRTIRYRRIANNSLEWIQERITA